MERGCGASCSASCPRPEGRHREDRRGGGGDDAARRRHAWLRRRGGGPPPPTASCRSSAPSSSSPSGSTAGGPAGPAACSSPRPRPWNRSSESRASVYRRAVAATTWSAFRGLVIGGSLAFIAALVAAGVPFLRRSITRLAAIANAAPWVAVAPCLIIILGKSRGPTAVAALAVFFFIFISTTVGLSAAPAATHDVASVLGASRFQRMWLVQLPAAWPSIADGLKLAAPGGAGGRHLRRVVRRPPWSRRAADHRHAVGPAPAAVGGLVAQRHDRAAGLRAAGGHPESPGPPLRLDDRGELRTSSTEEQPGLRDRRRGPRVRRPGRRAGHRLVGVDRAGRHRRHRRTATLGGLGGHLLVAR